MGLTWMAWTWETAAFFVFIFAAITAIGIIEIWLPGGVPRRGVFGLATTLGDRLFISLLGSAYIFLAWIGLMGTPLWGALGLALAWWAFVFWKA